jgi:HAD superfamily phosphoserine phosphatase-like hydrolase
METIDPPRQSQSKHEFVASVLRLSPRLAAFDCDGTLWSSDAGETFFDWEIRRGLVTTEVGDRMRVRYADYKAGKVNEHDMCGEMVSMHQGLTDAAVMEAASEFMAHAFPGRFFPEMRELVQELNEQGCEIWAVSSSNEWVIRAGLKPLGIREQRIITTKAVIEKGMITDRLVRIPAGAGKAEALREIAKKDVDAAFGNSRFDTEMLAMAKHAFAINPNPDLEATARQHGWTVYFPDGTARK